MSSDVYTAVVRELASGVSGSLGHDADEDFWGFSFRDPSSEQFVEWCLEAGRRIEDEPIDRAADEQAIWSLLLVRLWVLALEDDAARASVARDFWRAYAAVSGANGALQALEGLDNGDESWADRADATMWDRYRQAS